MYIHTQPKIVLLHMLWETSWKSTMASWFKKLLLNMYTFSRDKLASLSSSLYHFNVVQLHLRCNWTAVFLKRKKDITDAWYQWGSEPLKSIAVEPAFLSRAVHGPCQFVTCMYVMAQNNILSVSLVIRRRPLLFVDIL